MNSPRLVVLVAALNALVAVAAGAFAAHALEGKVEPRLLEAFETGARYQMYHALGLFVTASLVERGWRLAPPAAWLFLAGIILFSGSLYLLALTGITRFGMVTPLGGVAFLGGWGCIAACAWPRREPSEGD